MSSDERLKERRERGTHREGDGARLRRFCVLPALGAPVGTEWWTCRGDMELLPREEEHDDEETEEMDPRLCETLGERVKECSGDWEMGDVWGDVSSDEGESDLGGEQTVMLTGLRAQRLTCRLRLEATPKRRPQMSQTKAFSPV